MQQTFAKAGFVIFLLNDRVLPHLKNNNKDNKKQRAPELESAGTSLERLGGGSGRQNFLLAPDVGLCVAFNP